MQKDDEIISPSEMADIIDLTPDNIRKTYRNKSEKSKFYQALQMGCYCMQNGVNPQKVVAINKIINEANDGN